MTLPTWLRIFFTYAPLILEMDPKTAAIAGPVSDAIAAAQMGGKDGASKKAAVLEIAKDAILSINDQTGRAEVPMDATLAVTSSAIDTIISVVGAVHQHAVDAIAAAPVLPPIPVPVPTAESPTLAGSSATSGQNGLATV